MSPLLAKRPTVAPSQRTPGHQRTPGPQRVLGALQRAAPAIAAYLCVRAVGLVGLALWAWRTGERPQQLLGGAWDSIWYQRVAEYGYGTVIPSALQQGWIYDDRAFFPLYPALIRIGVTVFSLGPVYAALLVSWVASVVAAWGIYAVGERIAGRGAGWTLTVLWGVLPHAVVESMAYTESLLTAFAAWALYAVLTDRWVWAGALATGAGLTRPTGIAVATAVGVAALAEVVRQHYAGGTHTERRGEWAGSAGMGGVRATTRPPPWEGRDWRPWTGAALAPMGWLAHVVYVGYLTGRPDGYFEVQRRWGATYDFGAQAAGFVRGLVLGQGPLLHYMALAVVVTAVVLFTLGLVGRQPLPLIIYSAAMLAISLGGSNFFQCKPRFLLPAFTLLLPAAAGLAGARRGTVAVLLLVLTLLSAAYGAYLLTIAHSPL